MSRNKNKLSLSRPISIEKVAELITKIRKYQDYVLNLKCFNPYFKSLEISDQALLTAKSIRGEQRKASVMIHGIMKRSGTVYTGELLGLHPEVYPYPYQLWETPFLPVSDKIQEMQNHFFLAYPINQQKMGRDDFLPLFGSAFIAYLTSCVPENQRILLKMPGVQYLNLFFAVFPHENLLVLVRDGRDVVTSTIKTWPQLRFWDVCRRWNRSARMILACDQIYSGKEGYWLARYEDLVADPAQFVLEACSRFHLSPEDYPFHDIENIPVHGSSLLDKKSKKEGRDWMPKTSDFKPVGRWQQWSTWQKQIFKLFAGKSLQELNYCDNMNW